MDLFIHLIPVILILILLFIKKHMLVAGIIGGATAMVIGGISIAQASDIFLDGIANMLSITIPILYASAAVMVSRAGSIQALIELARRTLKGKISILAGIIVLIQGLATYMAGMGAGNTMVTAPLMAAAIGAVPEVIAAMAIISAIGFTTSPASTETALTAESATREVTAHASSMFPFVIVFYLLAIGLAIYGVHKRGAFSNKEANQNNINDTSNMKLIQYALPAIALLIMVVFGGNINSLLGVTLITPATTIIFTALLTVVLTPLTANETSEALIDGSKFILTTLFSVGIFLGFINMIAELGLFEQVAALASQVPTPLVLPVAMILAFLIAIPSGAFAAGVLTLILPTLAVLGLPSEAMGFVAIATGLGTQVSPVQINVAALAKGFNLEIIDVIKSQAKYVVGMLGLVIIIAVIFV
ncbi:citrate transporter [Amphibacillus cookii]|uniref:citrate transporter n=1 Tax=Amphibacillus cookii TaxID=767787 RepID=UPI00195BECB6|nr:citrate transporter [Amphibacillus cookii]MBM7541550.1 heme/copper-type cytochrome/quinol oxidase subunit 2 [Amphibacillus cookii]